MFGRERGQAVAHPVPDPAGTVEGFRVSGAFKGFEQSGKDLVQRVVRRPDLRVRGKLFEQRELIGRVGGEKTFPPDGRIAAPLFLRTVVRGTGGDEIAV
jgi:hypothetical protein